MRTITLITLLLFSLLSLKAENSTQTADNLTEWMTASEFQTWFDTNMGQENGYYPIFVEGRLINGEDRFRAIIALKPQVDFSFWTHHGISDSYYKQRLEDRSRNGYVLISHQTFVDIKGNTRHQATWARTPNRMNAPKMMPPTDTPPSKMDDKVSAEE